MKFEGSATFAKAIEEHLELKRRNSQLEAEMPLARYTNGDPFQNHPLFKTEEQARLEETLSGTDPILERELALARPGAESANGGAALEDTLWGRSRDFDWGD